MSPKLLSDYFRPVNRRSRSVTRTDRRTLLRSTAEETQALLPGILSVMPQAPPTAQYCPRTRYPALNPRFSPKLSTHVEVLFGDTFDIAIRLSNPSRQFRHSGTQNVCVLNMANEENPGGGWLNGAMAQEEALCYRSSLSLTLKRRYYPIGERDSIYSPTVIVFRESFTQGHGLMDLQKSELLPVVSVISVAALEQPEVDDATRPPRFKHSSDRELTKDKMRTILRISGYKKHRRIVLGALGCGAFANPNVEVAECWSEVLQEREFQGWWEKIVFAVLDDMSKVAQGDSNFDVFRERLHGLKV
ncbi:mitochondrial chaperone BCS1 [Aspergillus sclerotioniger CBS 115572]|uniref:Mitochondrial chaperone BCS1 n=1 Tax=Aspergillus sclerotioniger CBS 115572 TaxID=1450535 RepID=A0A317X973_9EURO|nr:mitochondrial chaperone BCS1 [Aspergillus sclerotioniger CBS 115572]PWY95049.1 mitochondrial chaperone BCS1 [Aspergillus sclerotioniger CBS 115572]